MKHLISLLTMAITFTGLGQQVPFNPDANADGFVAVSDILESVAQYGGQFYPEDIMVGDTSLTEWIGLIYGTLQAQQATIDSVIDTSQSSFESLLSTLQEADSVQSAAIDSLQAIIAATDIQGGDQGFSGGLSLSCVATGVAPICSGGSGFAGEEPVNNYSYSLSTYGISSVTLDLVSANWRKFSLSSEMSLSDTLGITLKIHQYNTFDGGSWNILTAPAELVKNESGTYDFFLYARGGYGNSQSCTGDWDLGAYFSEPAFQAKNYSSGCYCSSTWRHIEIWYQMDGFLRDSGIRFGIE